MKKISIYISLFLITCFMGGCTQQNKDLSVLEVEELIYQEYDAYRALYYKINGGGLRPTVHIEDGIVITPEDYRDGYFKVEDDKISTMEELYFAVEEVCTKEFAEKEFYAFIEKEPFLYREIDGKLYIALWDDVTFFADIATINIIEQTELFIKAEIETVLYGMDEEENADTHYMELEKIEGRWYIGDFETMR